ncbi:MAG: hypothetical protein EON59_05865 [Alphaproteobacteria bacterium]|nr:MAG: hypothetical protein EON59_05865 [Alphaproteobacteria bacterium]
MRISILGEEAVIDALKADLVESGLMPDADDRQAGAAEVERLGFDIGVVVEVLGGLVTTAKAVDLARKFLKSAALGRSKVIEIKGPTGARTIKLDGKTEAEVEDEILKALPFLK